jgi:hypothetical protein
MIGKEDGGDTGGGSGGGLRDQMSLLSYIGVGDARVAPCGVDSDAHLILIKMFGSVMEAHHAGGGVPGDLV